MPGLGWAEVAGFAALANEAGVAAEDFERQVAQGRGERGVGLVTRLDETCARVEPQRLEERGANKLAGDLVQAREKLKAVDADLGVAEGKHSGLREQQERAASGDAGPQEQARRVIEDGLAKASFPDSNIS